MSVDHRARLPWYLGASSRSFDSWSDGSGLWGLCKTRCSAVYMAIRHDVLTWEAWLEPSLRFNFFSIEFGHRRAAYSCPFHQVTDTIPFILRIFVGRIPVCATDTFLSFSVSFFIFRSETLHVLKPVESRVFHRWVELISHLSLLIIKFCDFLRCNMIITVEIWRGVNQVVLGSFHQRVIMYRWNNYIAFLENWIRRILFFYLVESAIFKCITALNIVWTCSDIISTIAILIWWNCADRINLLTLIPTILSKCTLSIQTWRLWFHTIVEEGLGENAANRVTLLHEWYECLAHTL